MNALRRKIVASSMRLFARVARMSLEFRPLKGTFGAEVIGTDPALRVTDAQFAEIEAAWFRHSILLFRGLVDVKPADQIAFTRRFGPLHIMVPTDYNLEAHPE